MGWIIQRLVNWRIAAVVIAVTAIVAGAYMLLQRSIHAEEALKNAQASVTNTEAAGAIGAEHQARIIEEQREAAEGERTHFSNDW